MRVDDHILTLASLEEAAQKLRDKGARFKDDKSKIEQVLQSEKERSGALCPF